MENQTTPSHLRPFDIEKAKNGAKVVTFNGLVANILKYDFKLESGEEIMIVMISGYPNRYKQDGTPYDVPDIWDGLRDLFLLPNMIERWVNIYRDSENGCEAGDFFDTKEEAIHYSTGCIATVRIEWEE